jgi:hypothetical protein
MSRRPPRSHRDANHGAIDQALRVMGIVTLDLSALGSGCPDIAATGGPLGNQVWMVEVKNSERRGKQRQAQPHQQAWMAAWPGPSIVLTTVDEALAWATAQRARGGEEGR